MRKFILLLLISICLNLFAQSVVSTTSWVAAYAEAAGAENVYSFAPAEMTHPPEYELKPGDVAKLQSADLILFSGYEAMVKELKGPLQLEEDKLLQIKTGYGYRVISESILKIAQRAGSIEAANKSLNDIKTVYENKRDRLKADGFLDKKVIVHFHQQGIATELGLNVVGVFGPEAIKPSELAQIKESDADYIIDNIHSPLGKVIVELLPKAEYLSFVNFPGTMGTNSLLDVISYNLDQLGD